MGSTPLRDGIEQAERIGGERIGGIRATPLGSEFGGAQIEGAESFKVAQAMPSCQTGAIPGINFNASSLQILQGGAVVFSDATNPFISADEIQARIWEVFVVPDPGVGDIANDQVSGVVSCDAFPSQPPDPPVQARIVETDGTVTTACFSFATPGTYTVRLTIQTNGMFSAGAVVDCVTRNDLIVVTGTGVEMNSASFTVEDWICMIEGGGVLPGNEWIPLLRITMNFPRMTPAPRFLRTLDFTLATGEFLDDSSITGGDPRLFEENLLEFGVFLDRGPLGVPDSDFDLTMDGLEMQGVGLIPGVPFLRWEADGSPDQDLDNSSDPPIGAPTNVDMFASDQTPPGPAGSNDPLHYIINFVDDFRDLDNNSSTPFIPFASFETIGGQTGLVQRYLDAGISEDGFESYFIAVRLNQSIQHRQSIRVVVENAEMVTINPPGTPFNQPTPGIFPLNQTGDVLDGYAPDFYEPDILAEDCARVSELEIWEMTGSLTGDYVAEGGNVPEYPDFGANAWNWPNRLYTPIAEYSRPRFDVAGLAFDVVGGELMDLRRIFALDQWTEVIGINAHGPVGQLTEINMIFTDIGADPFGPPGNGGFDPRQGLERFTTRGPVSGDAIGDDYAFNGVWVYYDTGGGTTRPETCPGDCNGNGVFDIPEQLAGGGVTFVDFPMRPDLRFPQPDQSIPGLLEWEYIPFPPGGGDPWWKIRLRFANGRRGSVPNPTMECTGELELCQESPMGELGSIDYFVVYRSDSGFTDISQRPGDGVGLQLGADFRAFVEPRRTNPLLPNNFQDGGISFGSTLGGNFGPAFNPTTSPDPNEVLENFPGVRAVDFPNAFEPWWHERFINRNNVKPSRNGIEVHDLVLTYNSDNNFAKLTAITVGDGTVFRGDFVGPISFSLDNLDLQFEPFRNVEPTYFDAWIDPFQVLRQHFFDLNSVGVTQDRSDAFSIPHDSQYAHQWSFESVPFFNVFFDGDNPTLSDRPRSNLFPVPQVQPTLPAFNPQPPVFDPNAPRIGAWPPQFPPLAGNIGPLEGAAPNGFVSFFSNGALPDDPRDDEFAFTVAGQSWAQNQFQGAWLIDQKQGKYRILSNTNNTLIVANGQSIAASQFRLGPTPSGSSWLIVSDTLQPYQYTRITDWPLQYKSGGTGRAARILKQHIDTPDPAMELLGFDGQTAMLGINLVGADDIIINSVDNQRLFLERITVAFWGPDFDPRRDLQSLESTGTAVNSGLLLYEDAGSATADGSNVVVGDGVFGGVMGGDEIVPLNALAWPLEPELVDIDGDGIPDDLSGDGRLNPPGIGMPADDLNDDGEINSLDGLDLAWVARLIPDDSWVVPFTDSSFNAIPINLPFGGLSVGDPDDDGEPDEEEPAPIMASALSSYTPPASSMTVQQLRGTMAGAVPQTKAATKALNTVTNEGDDLFVVVQTSREIERFRQFRAFIPARLPDRTPASEQIAGIEMRPINYPRTGSFLKSNPEEGPVQDFYGHDMIEANVPASVVDLVEPGETIQPGGPAVAMLGIDVSTNRGDAAIIDSGTTGAAGPTDFTYVTPSHPNWTGPAHDPTQVVDQWLVGLNRIDGDPPRDNVDRVEAFRIVDFNGSTLTLAGGRPREGQWMVVKDPTFLEQVIVELYDAGNDRQFNIVQDLLPLNFENPAVGLRSGVSIYRDNDFNPGNVNGEFDAGDIPITLDDPPIFVGVVGEPDAQVKFTFSSPGTDHLAGDEQIPFANQRRLRQIIPESFGVNPDDPDFGPDFFVVVRPALGMQLGDDFAAGIVSWGPNTPTEPDPDQFTDPTVANAQILATDFDIFSEFPWGARGLGFITFFKEAQRTSFWTWDKVLQKQVVIEEADISQDHPGVFERNNFDRYWVRSTTSKFGVSGVLTSEPPIVVDFVAVPTRAVVDQSIAFEDLTTPANVVAEWLWDFGDGGTSTDENPVHSYAEPGFYTVSLTITTVAGTMATATKVNYIEILQTTPFADFGAIPPLTGMLTCDVETQQDGFTVLFQNRSVAGPNYTAEEFFWEFGDGTVDDTDTPNPSHTYRVSGIFDVRLTVTFMRVSGSGPETITDTRRIDDFVTVLPADPNRVDTDNDGVFDECDRCPEFPDGSDADMDGVPDGCDVCPGEDDNLDGDGDEIPDGCDICPLGDDTIDTDEDGVPDACDICAGDDEMDEDGDGVPDDCDRCPGFDDTIDSDGDMIPDACDTCQLGDNCANAVCLADGIPFFGTTLGATDEDIWHSYTPSISTTVVINTCGDGTDFDTTLEVFTTCSLASLIASDDDTCGVSSQVSVAMTAGVTYLIRVTGFGGDVGDYELLVTGGQGVCGPSESDSDGDGVPDECDLCPGADDNIDEDDDGMPDCADQGMATLTVEDSISAGDFDRNQHALVPLMDWMPLFNFNMAPDNDDPADGPVAMRILESLTYSIIFDPDADDQPYNALFPPIVSDLLEFGLFQEGGDPAEDFTGALNPGDTLLFTWSNTGAPVGRLISDAPGNIVYELDFVGTGNETEPDFPVRSGLTTDGQSYIVAMRTSATWISKIGLAYEVLDARMFPFPLDDMGDAEDSYEPNFLDGEAFDEVGTAYSSNFEVYDITGGPLDKSAPDPDFSNPWNYPISVYTPQAEFSRPRPDLGQSLFDFVIGEAVQLREILPLDGWAGLVGINLHSSAPPLIGNRSVVFQTDEDPPQPLVDLREVNVVFTDIGADPFGPEGNGGFDPRSGLEPFFDPIDGFDVGLTLAIGEDFAFNGAWVWNDTNNNGIFDPPTPNADGGASLVDLPVNPDLITGVKPQWEYIPFPPDGGDPWWKVRLRFSGGSRGEFDELSGFVENIPESDSSEFEMEGFEVGCCGLEIPDYFVVVRTDSGYRDVSLEPGDGTGMIPGADFKAFIEPRRFNALTGNFDGGIHLDSMIPASDFFWEDFPWQNDPRWLNIEPWWPERTQDQQHTKPVRTGVEVHDLVMLYKSRSQYSQPADIPFAGDTFVDQWLDPFGLYAGQFTNPREVFLIFWDIFVIFSLEDLVNAGQFFNILLTNEGNEGSHEAFETVPFRLPGVDFPPFGPRSQFVPAEALLPLPTLPTFETWPATADAQDYPHFTDWEREDRQARLLRQKVDSESEVTALLGINLAGSNDPEVNRVNRPVLDELYVAVWGPTFTPSDLLPLDPEGDNIDSGAMLWADSLDIGFVPGEGVLTGLPDGVFRGLPLSTAFLDDPFLTDLLLPVANLRWQNAPEPIDLDGDGLADDMDGDGIVDQRDHAWVLQLTPQSALPIPPNDQDNAGAPTMLPDGSIDPTGPVDAHGDDLFFVVRTSKSISRFEQFRAVVPATLPSRPEALRPAGIRMSPQGSVLASALYKSHPEEQVAFNFYDHDMMQANIPVNIVNLVPRNTQIVAGGPALPVFGIDISTNRPDGTIETGTAGTGGLRSFVDTARSWPNNAFAGKWLIDARFNSFEIVSNTATRLTLRGGTPASGAYRIVREPSFLEQIIVDFYRASPTSGFRLSADLLPLSKDQRTSGVAIYRDNDFNAQNRNGVFDAGIDIPVTLDDAPRAIGIGGRPDAQVKFVFSSPGTDNWPEPLVDQPSLRQWVPDTFAGSASDPFFGPDFFVVIRPSNNIEEGHDFGMGLVSFGPNTPTEPDPDTFTFPATQPADEFAKFSEFPFGNRALGFITFFEAPPTRYWLREARAFQEPEPDFVNWVRTTTSKQVLSGTLTAREPITTPNSIEVDEISVTQIPAVIDDDDPFTFVIRGSNFGENPTVVINGYLVEIISSTDTAIEVSLRNNPGVTPTEPIVIIITNPDTGETLTLDGDISLTGVRATLIEILDVTPDEGMKGDFPVMVRGVNFSTQGLLEVSFGETKMPILDVQPLGETLAEGTGGTAVDQVTFRDISKAWAGNEFAGQFLIDGMNGTFEILANDATTLTLSPSTRVPVSGAYGIYDSEEIGAKVGFPNGGLPKTGAQDVTVRNLSPASGGVLAEDTLLSGFMFVDDPARPCFIATAAYGSPLEMELDTFRAFRDGVLLKSAPGVALVETYYRVSPAIAERVAAHPALAWLVRAVLTPVAWSLKYPLIAVVAVCALCAAGWLRIKKLQRNNGRRVSGMV